MRVCLLTLDFKPCRSSGLAVYAEDLTRGLAEAGHSVTVVTSQGPGLPARTAVNGARLFRLPAGPLDWLSYGLQAARWVRLARQRTPFDIVHFCDVHFAYAYRGPFVGSLWQSFRQRLTAAAGRPYHLSSVDRWRREVYYRLARGWLEQPSVARAGRLIASCRSTRDEFISHYGVAEERIDLAVQGIDTEFFRPTSPGDLRRRLGLEGYHVLLFFGFAAPRKNLETLGHAMRLLPDNVHLVIAGQWARGYRQRVVKALGPALGRVHEVGYVADEDRPRYYSMADVYVSPSLLEGLGITPIEAMACGTSAIVTSSSSGPEEVGNVGRTVPPQDPQALAAAIRELLADSDLRRQLSQRGRDRVLQHFTYQRMSELTALTYARFLGDRCEGGNGGPAAARAEPWSSF
jgi:D-inositol-3-phosphate glycosyltransferase